MSVASASKNPSLAQAFADELRQLKGRSPRTAESYGQIAARFLENCEGKPAAGDARSFIAEAAKHLAPASQAQWVSALRELLRWGAQRGHWESGLERGLVRPKTPRKLIRVVDEEDLPPLLKAVAKRPDVERLLFDLLYGSGLRISEALQTRAKDLRPGPALFVLGKGARGREVPVSAQAEVWLRELDRGDGPWPPRSSARSLRRWVENWGKSALLADNEGSLHPHKLRHSLATHLLRRGAKLPQLQKLLGHQQLGTTERYTHLDAADLLQAYDKAFPRKLVKK